MGIINRFLLLIYALAVACLSLGVAALALTLARAARDRGDNVPPLGINHQSPLIYCDYAIGNTPWAGNQSPIPFDILAASSVRVSTCWESITNPL